MTPVATATAGLAAIVVVFSLVWLVSVRRHDASIVDIWWGPGFALLAWMYCAMLDAYHPRPLLAASLITVWAARLAWHISERHRGGDEDPRYTAIRGRHGDAFWWRSLFLVFWLQAVLVWFIALPVLVVATASESVSLGVWDATGAAISVVGFAFEAIGDHQLRRFKRTPANRGRVLDAGLWRYTRHPNYFGDTLFWWGVYLIASALPAGRLAIASPMLMTFLLVRVSGVTLLESTLRTSKPDYAAYCARTSAFIPWFPRREGIRGFESSGRP